jgi:hypothetical protein
MPKETVIIAPNDALPSSLPGTPKAHSMLKPSRHTTSLIHRVAAWLHLFRPIGGWTLFDQMLSGTEDQVRCNKLTQRNTYLLKVEAIAAYQPSRQRAIPEGAESPAAPATIPQRTVREKTAANTSALEAVLVLYHVRPTELILRLPLIAALQPLAVPYL